MMFLCVVPPQFVEALATRLGLFLFSVAISTGRPRYGVYQRGLVDQFNSLW
jgi:hypothetical protein